MRLVGTAALVTGASRGLGLALVGALARRGVRVVGVAQDGQALEAALHPLREEGLEVYGLVSDVAAAGAVQPLVSVATSLVGPLDVMVHTPSTVGRTPLSPLLDTAGDYLTSVLETNVMGSFRITQAIAKAMVRRGRGLVVHVSSGAVVQPRWGAAGVSRAALEHLGRLWAAELEGTGVRFLSVDPAELDVRMCPDGVAARLVGVVEQQAEALPSGTGPEPSLPKAA
ncbi:SDR family oxidoreductase [Corallococcus sp. M34]|uniref:SDR family NAD(P)-dependent oxidoreductase n=1 Tax=Citreicoccus inhibens TaxID=2849499 RepID=UPI001C23CB37|nr:SDR family oxidoreductase [Citreicoccus inhibens]MBU8895407.1 SDR family oxidoreductase [Citreicoccus inhibens]